MKTYNVYYFDRALQKYDFLTYQATSEENAKDQFFAEMKELNSDCRFRSVEVC